MLFTCRRTLLVLASIVACAAPTFAAPILVQNHSFELPGLGYDTFGSERFGAGPPPGWFGVGSGGTGLGVVDPSNTQYAGTNPPVLPGTADGAQYGFLNLPANFSNTLTYNGSGLGTFANGATYTLTVALGGRREGGGILSVSAFNIVLLANGTPVGAGTTAPAIANTFFDLTYTFTATSAVAGQNIGIQFTGTNTTSNFQQANFDNVRLEIVPEPATLAIIGLFTAGVAARRRRSAGSAQG